MKRVQPLGYGWLLKLGAKSSLVKFRILPKNEAEALYGMDAKNMSIKT